MNTFFNLRFFGEAFITLFVITDPLGVVPVFLALTRGYADRQRKRLARQAAVVAFGVIVGFAAFGQSLLKFLGITVPALQLAGGLLLLLVALDLLTGKVEPPADKARSNVNVAMVPLGTPLLAGPGAIVATIVFVQRADHAGQVVALGVAIVAVHIVLWLTMRFSIGIIRIIKDNGVELVTRIAGLLLAAIAVQLSAEAVEAFIKAG
ncbi:MAG TPA: MarC family protein [Streptosporangiaceae bacterium]|jgi:multiple antibiotic resistance protein